MQRQQLATVAGPQEPVSGTRGPVVRGPAGPGDAAAMDSTPQVLARIPSLASELPDDDPVAEGAGQSRLLGSRASLKILAAVGGALFLLALWGFVFDRNKSSNQEAGGPVSAKEPFRPEVPAPNAPEAPRWAGLSAGAEPRAGGLGPISAEARPVSPDAPTAAAGPWTGAGPTGGDRGPMPWTLSQGSSAPASPAWNGQDSGRSEPVIDWTTQPYPSTADRTKPPVWDMSPGTGPAGSVAGARWHDLLPSDAAARSAVNPVYRDDRDPARAAPAAYTDPAMSGSRWPAADSRPADSGQGMPASSNRPVSLAQRPSLDRQLPASPAGVSRDIPTGAWNGNSPADSRSPGAPHAGPNSGYGPAPGYSSGPASGGAASGAPASGYAPAAGVTSGPAMPWNQRGYDLPQPPPAASPTPPSNPYHNLLPMYQGPASGQPALPNTPNMDAYRTGAPREWPRAGQGPLPGTSGSAAPGYGGPSVSASQSGGYGPSAAPWGGNPQAPGGVAYPPSYSLPVSR